MSGKLIFLDIDGTLVNKKREIPPSAAEAVRQARAAGHKLFICSGRAPANLPEEIRALGFDGYVMATGAVVIAGERTISTHTADPQKLAAMARILEHYHATYYLLGVNGIYIHEAGFAQMQRDMQGLNPALLKKFTVDPHLTERTDITSWDYILCDIRVDQLQEIIDAELGGYFHAEGASFGNDQIYNGEITVTGVSKASGIAELVRYFDASPEDTIAIGDGMNDLNMFSGVSVKVAMGNAVPALKAKADYITSSVDEDGIRNALLQLGLIGGAC